MEIDIKSIDKKKKKHKTVLYLGKDGSTALERSNRKPSALSCIYSQTICMYMYKANLVIVKVTWKSSHPSHAKTVALFKIHFMPSNSTSHPDQQCLTLGLQFNNIWTTFKNFENWCSPDIWQTTFFAEGYRINSWCHLIIKLYLMLWNWRLNTHECSFLRRNI